MNDLAEVRQGWDFIREWVAPQDTNDRVMNIIRAACEVDSPVIQAEGLYICCASTRADDANQWRLYGGRGRGYAVELDAGAELAALARSDGRTGTGVVPPGTASHWGPLLETTFVTPWLHVLYSRDEKTEALGELVANARRRWGGLNESHLGSIYDGLSKQFAGDVMSAVAQVASLMKSDGFSGENEVRTVVSPVFDEVSKFRATETGVLRYVRLTSAPIDHEKNSLVYRSERQDAPSAPVLSVCVGPLLDAGTSVAVIKALLNRNGYDGDKVTVSDVPLRP